MPAPARLHSVSLGRLCGLLCLIAPVMAGCNNGPTAQQQVDAAFQANPEARLKVAKFEGIVTIDGQPPGKDYPQMQMFLVDADKFQDPKRAQRWQAPVDENGHFIFATYLKDDGAPVGKYVALFVVPEATVHVKSSGGRPTGTGFGGAKTGPDKLKNLYNDPEQNVKDPAFVINLQEPGITDQRFNLQVAGKDPAVPGKYAVQDVPVASGGFKFGS
jgi:hypothetical protein